jgi:NTP pyrophosphatase (non-canonical NTP hydrolase)
VANSTHNADSVISLVDYAAAIACTDVLDPSNFSPVLQGLYGEVGGIMSAAKKLTRDGSAYPGYKKAAEEEFGDTLWYLAALCRRMNIPLDQVFTEAVGLAPVVADDMVSKLTEEERLSLKDKHPIDALDSNLFHLGRSAAALLENSPSRSAVVSFVSVYLDALQAASLNFSDIARNNLHKAQGAFCTPELSELIDFDSDFPSEEQLPRQFRIRINQRGSGRSYLQWNGVFIGDPLTDNIADPDGYRFHDVFHFAYVAILHWSPVVRALIKHKRKSKPEYDEAQDGGRAIVVEEGLTAWIFSRAKELKFFENEKKISLGMLKTIGEFVNGYEVDKCPLKLWEKAILEGYSVFRQVKFAQGGWIVGDRDLRTIRYEALEQKK